MQLKRVQILIKKYQALRSVRQHMAACLWYQFASCWEQAGLL